MRVLGSVPRLAPVAIVSGLLLVCAIAQAGGPTFVHEAQLGGHADPIDQVADGEGQSVAVDGDTAVVGSFVFGGGVAHVYVRSGTTWSLQQTLAPSDSPVTVFGSAVALSGDTIVVGAFGTDTPGGVSAGAAYVFVRSGTTWTQQQKLTASDPGPYDDFGLSVAVDGERAVIGSLRGDAPGAPDAGAAYVFARSGTTWIQQQKLNAVDAAPGDGFGRSVSIEGNTLLVGAVNDGTPAGTEAGSAYVFVRPGTIWLQEQKLTASDAATQDFFGSSACLSGDSAVLGAFGKDAHAGAAYVFVRSGSVWSEQQRIDPTDGVAEDHFGWSVSLEGDTLVVGALTADTANGTNAGAAYVFVRSGTSWTEQQKLVAANGAPAAQFGTSVSLAGTTALVGAPGDLPAPPGAAYVFVSSSGAWSEQQQLVPPDSVVGDEFGDSVSLSGDTLLVGALDDDTAGGAAAGSAYVFVRSGTAWAEQQKLTASDGVPGDVFGRSVSLSGDTALVGAAQSAYVFVRSGNAWSEEQKLAPPPGGGPGDFFGASVSLSGDTAVVGARYTSAAAGAAYVYVRSGTSWALQQQLPTAGGQAGASVSISGDTVAVGAPYATYPVQVFVRSGTLWSLEQELGPAGGSPIYLGESVAVSGDTLAVGTGGFSPYEPGSAFVFVRSGSTWSEEQKLEASDGVPSDGFSSSLAFFGDSLAAGANAQDPGGAPTAGAAYVFARSGSVWTEQQKLVAPDLSAGDGFGTGVSLSADRLAVGAPWDDRAAGVDAGSAHVFRLQGSGTADLAVTKTDGQTTAPLGQPLTYTIVVSNAGPDTVILAGVTDVLPPELLGATWTCGASAGSSCTPSGSGSIAAFTSLLVGGTATFTLAAIVDPSASGALVNTASVGAPAGFVDPDPSNDSATDTDTLILAVDLSVVKTDGQGTAVPGQWLTYTITVANAGPSEATGALVSDAVPAALPGATWTCSASAGSTCTPSGAGSISDSVSLLAGGVLQYHLTGRVDPAATGTLVNAATVTPPVGVTDVDPTNDSATDTDVLLPTGFLADGELSQGDGRWYDLGALPGPVADEDLFRIFQRPHASYEVLLDGASGDLGSGSGPLLERLGSDASTVVESSSPAGAGGSRSLRWMNAGDQPVADQLVRVRSAGCSTDCDPGDVYRLALTETTGFIPRFNNTASQVTVLVVQNLGDAGVDLDVRLWSESGALLVGPSVVSLGARQTYVLDTSTVAPGESGSISVAHTGRHGQLAGKAIAVEPATGFTFETAMQERAR